MKKNYSTPRLSVVPMATVATMLASSNLPQERGDRLYWSTPDYDESFDSDEEIA